jgi:type IX secretion system substrate protein
MKRFFTVFLFAAFLLTLSTSAKVSTNMVSIGNGYADQVWFSFSDDATTTVTSSDWDLFFHTGAYSGGIGINGGNGMELYLVVDSDGDSFDDPKSGDTTGLSADFNGTKWKRTLNSSEKWDVGAFNLDNDGFGDGSGDFGWGVYQPATHNIVGDYLFLIKLSNGDFKKIMVDGLVGGIYVLRFADLDGSNETEIQVNKTKTSGRLLAYYSFENGVIYDREPMYTAWDITFHRYIDLVKDIDGNFHPYGVTGCKQNEGGFVALVENGDYENELKPSDDNFFPAITTIGHTWKEFDMANMGWIIYSNNIYFVKLINEEIYKLRFVDFGGSADGNIYFDKVLYDGSSVEDDAKTLGEFFIYPNVIDRGEQLSIVYHQNPDISNATISIMSSTGAAIASYSNLSVDGLNTLDLSELNLSSGMYFAVMTINGKRAMQKFVVK